MGEKVGLKLNVQKTKIMASGPITSWEIDGESVETVSDFIFWAPKSLQMVIAPMKLKDTYSLEGMLCLALCNSLDCSPQAPLSMEFSRQEYWSGLSFPPPGDRKSVV